MIYFDTDVIIHSVVLQDEIKQNLAINIIEQATENNQFFLSDLNLQEILFVLGKLSVERNIIAESYSFFLRYTHYSLNEAIFNRAYEISQGTSFKNINDSLHTSIAEHHCQKFVTFNKKDFKKIQRISDLEIHILDNQFDPAILFSSKKEKLLKFLQRLIVKHEELYVFTLLS